MKKRFFKRITAVAAMVSLLGMIVPVGSLPKAQAADGNFDGHFPDEQGLSILNVGSDITVNERLTVKNGQTICLDVASGVTANFTQGIYVEAGGTFSKQGDGKLIATGGK